MSVASDLFYKQGYRATGINEVIEKSGVAKATFYNHFPTKDDLCKAYLKGLSQAELSYLDQSIVSARDPVERFLSAIQSLGPWLLDTDFRGCGFLNMASEIPDFSNPLRREGTRLYDSIRQRIDQLCRELVEADTEKYGHLDVQALSNDYMVVFGGAVALSEIYHAIWPVEQGVQTMRRLIGE